jgi:hypothetical protein
VSKPIAIDLFCGLGGWTEGLLAAGYDVIGFDNERHEYGEHKYPAQLVLQDVRTLHGSQFAGAALIVASPPCQEFSYMAMPWSRAKKIAMALRGFGYFPDGYTGSRTLAELTALFDACFRLQREAIAATGRHIPLVVENVNGAQPWVGTARWRYGSFYLWGDIPALMSMSRKVKVPGFSFDGRTTCFVEAAIKNSGGSWFKVAHNTTSGTGRNPDGRPRNDPRDDATKVGGDWFGQGCDSPMRQGHSKSPKRKAASALIAKIPFALSHWIARAWLPEECAA